VAHQNIAYGQPLVAFLSKTIFGPGNGSPMASNVVLVVVGVGVVVIRFAIY